MSRRSLSFAAPFALVLSLAGSLAQAQTAPLLPPPRAAERGAAEPGRARQPDAAALRGECQRRRGPDRAR